MLGRREQRLRWNAPDVDARPAERLVVLDANGVESELAVSKRADTTAGSAADDRYITIRHVLLDQHRGRIFDELLDAYEELDRMRPFDEAMVIRQRDVHHRPDDDLAVDRNRTILGFVQDESDH